MRAGWNIPTIAREHAHGRPSAECASLYGWPRSVTVEWRDDPWSEVFDEDYLYFYADRLAAGPSDRETEQILEVLALGPGAAVLDAPCGHGRIANRLAVQGLEVVGLDNNPDFLELGRRAALEVGVDVEYVLGDLRELPWSGRFDAALNWYTSAGYFDDEGNARMLAGYQRALKPGGRLLLEQINRDSLIRQIPAGASRLVALTERGDDLMIDRVHFDLAAGRSRTERIVVRDGKVRRVRFSLAQPTLPELCASLREAGFAQVDVYGIGSEPLRPDSRRMLIAASVPAS
jgi:SAM-dependent methyltransferase